MFFYQLLPLFSVQHSKYFDDSSSCNLFLVQNYLFSLLFSNTLYLQNTYSPTPEPCCSTTELITNTPLYYQSLTGKLSLQWRTWIPLATMAIHRLCSPPSTDVVASLSAVGPITLWSDRRLVHSCAHPTSHTHQLVRVAFFGPFWRYFLSTCCERQRITFHLLDMIM